MLQTNGGHTVAVSANGTYPLATLTGGTSYTVAASAQPTAPSQTCNVANPSGTLNANVTLTITCVTNSYTISANVVGLSGASTGLVLQLDGTSNPTIHASGTVALTPTVASGATYTVAVLTPPSTPTQSCVPSPATGPVTNAPITVTVTCVTSTFTVGGTVSGVVGNGLVLKDTVSGHTTTPAVVAGAMTFTIATAVNSGALYDVVVQTQPTTPGQYCTVANPTGTVGGTNVTSVAVTCRNEGRFAFFLDSTAQTVTPYSIDTSNGPTAGVLTVAQAGPFAAIPTAGSNPVAIAIAVKNPSGTYLYTADNGSGDVAQFSAAVNGAVTFVGVTPTGITGSTPTGIAIDPSGDFLLVTDSESGTGGTTNGAIAVFSISQVDGTLTLVANSPFLTAPVLDTGAHPTSVAVDPSDKYVYATNLYNQPLGLAGFTIDTVTSDPTAGNLTPFATNPQVPTAIPGGPSSVTIDPLDRFVYVANSFGNTVSGWTINSTSGALTAIPGSPFGGTTFSNTATVAALAIDPSGQFLYGTDSTNNDVVAFAINPTTGALTALSTGSTLATGNGPNAEGIDPSGHFLYVVNSFDQTISMYADDLTTGELSVITGSPTPFSSITGPNAIAIE
jgi:6-phosphogluconolactonase (cycloisomerase 2 family)